MAKKIYLGSSDFVEIVTNNGLLADKTLLIKDIIESADKVILITRPRRWGKTLNQSMLQSFFSNEVNGIKTAGLFDNLAISKVNDGAYINDHQGKYPVIFISFKDVKENTFINTQEKLTILIQQLFSAHIYLLHSTILESYEKKIIEDYLIGNCSTSSIEASLQRLSQYLNKHFNQKVYILIDEYDTPLNSAYLSGYIDELTELMRNLFSSALKDNPNLQKGILTGILRISKDSMLSGLNNLEVSTILDKKYNQYFGFTNDELDLLFKEQHLERDEATVKNWYNGYNFAGITMYNPWSILSCLRHDGELEAYWVNTSNNKIIEMLLLEFRDDVQEPMVKLMHGNEVEVKLDKYVSFDLLVDTTSSFWGLLLFSGYLTIANISSTGAGLMYTCTLRVPNLEIKLLLHHFYQQWFYKCLRDNYNSFLKNLTQIGDVPKFSNQLNAYLKQSISVRDTGVASEKFYHGLVLGLLASLVDTHIVLSNYESGEGYADAIIIPLPNSSVDLGIIMEFKHAKIEDNLDKLAQDALAQIESLRVNSPQLCCEMH